MQPMNQNVEEVLAANLPSIIFPVSADHIEDQRLQAAATTAISTGTTTPMLKAELRCRIMKRRHEEGLPELPPDSEPSRQYELSPAELEKKERRREQNRRAAQKCRQRKKSQHSQAEQGYRTAKKRHDKLVSECDSLRRHVSTLQSLLVSHLAVCSIRLPPQQNLSHLPSDLDDRERQHRFPGLPEGQDSTATTSFLEVNKMVGGLSGASSSLPVNCFMASHGTEKPPDLHDSPPVDSHLVAAGSTRPHVTGTRLEADVTWMGDHHDLPPAAILEEDTTLNSGDVLSALQMLTSKDFASLAQELCCWNDCESRTLPDTEHNIPEETQSVTTPTQPPASVAQPIPPSQCHLTHLTPTTICTEELDLPGYPWGTTKFQQRRQRGRHEICGFSSGRSASSETFTPRHHHEDATKAGTTQVVNHRLQRKVLRHVTTSVSSTPPESPGARREVPSPAYPLPSVSPQEGFFQDWHGAEVHQVQSPDCHAHTSEYYTHTPDCEMLEDDECHITALGSEWFNSLGNPPE